MSQEEWDRRAAAVGITWVVAVTSSKTRTRARCQTCGHVWNAYPDSVRAGRGCPSCAGNFPLAQVEWDKRALLAGIEWEGKVIRAQSPVLARCRTCGYQWSPYPLNVAKGHGCPKCAGQAPLPQSVWNARAEAVGIEWTSGVINATALAPARCRTCGYLWEVSPNSVQQRGTGCPKCAGKVLTQSDWDMRAARADLVWEVPVTNAQTMTPVRCLTCGYRWKVKPNNVQQGGGCPRCAKYGFDPSGPSRLYLLVLPDPPLLKIGVMGEGRTRLDQHTRRGWQVVRTWSTATGTDALDLEDSVLSWWDLQGAIPAQRDEVPAGDGWTECVHVGRVDVPGTLAYVEGLIAEQRDHAPH